MAFALENLYDAIEEASRTMEEENEDWMWNLWLLCRVR
jgi:hypothetical protein